MGKAAVLGLGCTPAPRHPSTALPALSLSRPFLFSLSPSLPVQKTHRVIHRLEQRVSPLSLRVRGEELLFA